MQWSLQDLVTCHAVMLHGTPVVLKSDGISSLRGCTQSIWDVYTSCNARPYLYSINESLSKLHELKHWQKRYKSSISRYLKGRVELNAPKNQCLSDNNNIWEFLCTCNTNMHRWAKYTWNSTHTVSEYRQCRLCPISECAIFILLHKLRNARVFWKSPKIIHYMDDKFSIWINKTPNYQITEILISIVQFGVSAFIS